MTTTTNNNTDNKPSSNTAPTSTSSTTTLSSPSTLADSVKISGNALAGALWQAMSELAEACNLEILSSQKLNENGLEAAYTMTKTKASADKSKSEDQAQQLIADAISKGCETGVMVGTSVYGLAKSWGANAELNNIDKELTEVKSLRVHLQEPSTAGAAVGVPVHGEEVELIDRNARDTRIDQLKRGENLIGRTKADDERYIRDLRPDDPKRAELRDALKKQQTDLESSKSAYESQKQNAMTQASMLNQVTSAAGDGISAYYKSGKQFDMGEQDYLSTEAGNEQQQMAQSLGQIGGMSNKIADNEASIIQQYGQLIGNLGKPN